MGLSDSFSVRNTYLVQTHWSLEEARPCYFPKTVTDSKGKDKKTYPYESMMTPYGKLKSIENAKNYLKPDMTFEILDKAALNQTDDQAAEQLQKERSKLFKTIHERGLKSGWVIEICFSAFRLIYLLENTGPKDEVRELTAFFGLNRFSTT